MKKLSLIGYLLYVCLHAQAQNNSREEEKLIWYTDIKKASEVSKLSQKPLLALFTGSDWCPWCQKLAKDILQKPAFIEWAKKNVVLVELDFPRSKIQEAALAQQNRSLQEVFRVSGFPTVWLFFLKEDIGGKYRIEAFGSLGYPQQAEKGKEALAFIKEAEALLREKK